MNKPAKTGLLAASLVLVGASVAGCGGGGAPTDASEDDFCGELNSLFSDLGTMAGASQEDGIAALQSWADRLAEVGTPEDMPDEARAGFELMIKEVGDLDENATTEDFTNFDADLSEGEKADSDAFETYTTDTCGAPEIPELPEIPEPS